MRTIVVLIALALALVIGATLVVRAQFAVALTRLDCVNQPSTHLLLNDTDDWATYTFDASMNLDTIENEQLYVVKVAPHARLVVCVG